MDMTILVTGATGAIGGRLVERLVADGHAPRVASRRPATLRDRWPGLDAVEADVLRPATLGPALEGVSAAYYLVHSMEPAAAGEFRERDAEGARAFGEAAVAAGVERVIYLGGLGDDEGELSEHLASRHETGRILAETGPPLLEFRAAMVVSPDSASFTMLTDLVNRLPAMIVPRWVDTPSQPIAVDDVLSYLVAGLSTPLEQARTIVEIGGPDVTTYRRMIETVAAERGRRPVIVGVPLLTPRLSSYWCGLTTSVPSSLARPLIEGMTTPMVVRDDEAQRRFPEISPRPFAEALRRAFAEA
jgi:uncharacterized protein YbjT (DUF2867 family)